MAQRRRIRKKKRVSPLRRAGKLAYRILVVLSAIIVVLYCAYRLASKKPTQAPEPTPEAPAGSLSPDQTEAPGRQRREGTYTFLLAASDQSSGNADTIIVASYDTEAQKVGMVSVPRDTLLESGKINAAYHKGPENLRDTVSNLLGVPIDYYVAVDVDGFVALVDELGGIEFDVPVRMSFDDPTQDLHIHYQPGLQHLTGEDVLKVARCRNNSDGPGSYPDNLYGAYPDGDIGRTRTQQQLIAAILKKALSNPQKINSYVNLFLEYVDTDLEFSEALWFAQPALGLDFSTGFASATLAGENVYYVDSRGYRWGSCYELDPEARRIKAKADQRRQRQNQRRLPHVLPGKGRPRPPEPSQRLFIERLLVGNDVNIQVRQLNQPVGKTFFLHKRALPVIDAPHHNFGHAADAGVLGNLYRRINAIYGGDLRTQLFRQP